MYTRFTTVIYTDDASAYHPDNPCEYTIPRSASPRWYKQEIRGPARKCHGQPPRYQCPGQVLVDDETNTVYLYLCFR